MKNITLIIFTLFVSVFVQSQKLNMQDLKIVDYEVNSSNNIKIKSLATVDSIGNLIVYSDSWDGKNYFQYKLTIEEMKVINLLLNKDLESYVKQKQLNKNQFFGGNPRFITYKTNGKKKSLCFIEPFMDDDFKTVIKILNNKIYLHDESAKIKNHYTDFEKIKKEIFERSKTDNYLPVRAIIIQN